jgi:hypothetical protein
MSIMVGLWLLCMAVASLLLILVTRVERFQKIGAEIVAALLLASFPFVWVSEMAWPLMIVAIVIHMWFIVLPTRLIFGRLERVFLRASTRLNVLLGMAMACIVVALHLWGWRLYNEVGLAIIAAAAVVILLTSLASLLWNMRHYKLHKGHPQLTLKELPTVSVCVPARNEDQALTDCLQYVLASDYPKLEILVLDDCSQDKTSSVIRSFAHDGVRFLSGEAPASGWLGKNQAMQTLAQQASGQYLLFLSVDTHVTPQSISHMVEYALQHKLHMLSVLPRNRLGASAATFMGTLQYFWRIALPITRHRVPVSSKCWLISAQGLTSLGGFASVSQKVVPEESFAHRLFTRNTYRFLLSDSVLGLTTAKQWKDQIETSLRLLYPVVKRQPMLALMAVLAATSLYASPFVLAAILLVSGQFSPTAMLVYIACGLLWLNYYLVLFRTQPRNWFLPGILWPVVVAQEIVLLIVSMLQYEFGEVNWKGRNVCYPMLGLRERPEHSHQRPE